MKAARFEYERADSIEQACALLGQFGGDAKLIAGGQSLVPMMAMRLVRPAVLIDINHIPALKGVRVEADHVAFGACLLQRHATEHAALLSALPLLGQAMAWVGHVQTRNRGTLGGSIAHADPCAELPTVAQMLDAVMRVRDSSGEHDMPAAQFFDGPMANGMSPEQMLVEVRLPRWLGGRVGSAFEEVSIRHGDYAIVAAAAQIELAADGRCTRAAIGIGGAGAVPLSMRSEAAALVGSKLDDAAINATAEAVSRGVEPGADLHASVEYRRHLARVLTARVLRQSRDHAEGRGNGNGSGNNNGQTGGTSPAQHRKVA